PLRAQMKARRGIRLWSSDWWQARLDRRLPTVFKEVEGELDQAHGLVTTRAVEVEQLARQCQQEQTACQSDRAQLIAEEVAVRRGLLEDEKAALCQENHLLYKKWQAACNDLIAEVARPEDMTPEAVRVTRSAWQVYRENLDRRRTLSQEWVDFLE